jgi:hypothetical protein
MILFLGATLLIVTEVTARLQKAIFDTCSSEGGKVAEATAALRRLSSKTERTNKRMISGLDSWVQAMVDGPARK